MEIVSHRGALDGKAVPVTKERLRKLVRTDCITSIELDFTTTKDMGFVCSHGKTHKGKPISEYLTFELRSDGLVTLEDTLDIVNGDKGLLIDFKTSPDSEMEFAEKLFRIINNYEYQDKLMLQSFKQELIELLLKYKKETGVLNDVEIGLIINLFKTFNYRNKQDLGGLTNVDFVSLSSELYEWPIVGEDYKTYRKMLPEAKQYAWTWAPPYTEKDSRIENYSACGVDGIITNDPAKVRRLLS